MPKAPDFESEPSSKKLDAITDLLRDLFVLQAAQAGIKKKAVRKILGVGMTRVTRIWKHVVREKEDSK